MTYRAPSPTDAICLDDAAAVWAAVPSHYREGVAKYATPTEVAVALRATHFWPSVYRVIIETEIRDICGVHTSEQAVEDGLRAMAESLLEEAIDVRRNETTADALRRWAAQRREWADEDGSSVGSEVELAEALAAHPPRFLIRTFLRYIADKIANTSIEHASEIASGNTNSFISEVESIARQEWAKAARTWHVIEAARKAALTSAA